MPFVLLCKQGHQWPIDPAKLEPGKACSLGCPVCGELAVTLAAAGDSLPETCAPPTPPTPETPAPDASPLPATTKAPPTPIKGHAAPASTLTIPGYTIVGELGRGGMGVVYKAVQQVLNRPVALKMMLTGEHAAPHVVSRFRVEAEAVARLKHPHIVQIYEVGEFKGLPFLAFEFVDGGNLANVLAGRQQPPEKAALLVETLARAMAVAHKEGVVHRDLKPANVLVTTDGTPKIADFGLAKQTDHSTELTSTGAIMGTPSYMAPEQAEGRTKEIGPLTDVYALGAILYELLTGRPPFKGANMVETLDQVRSDKPQPPHRFQPDLAHDLERICLKCLEKNPKQRYPSALELAEDLARFLRGDPVEARKGSGVLEEYLANQYRARAQHKKEREKRKSEELRREQLRQKWLNICTALLVLLLAGGSVFLIVQYKLWQHFFK